MIVAHRLAFTPYLPTQFNLLFWELVPEFPSFNSLIFHGESTMDFLTSTPFCGRVHWIPLFFPISLSPSEKHNGFPHFLLYSPTVRGKGEKDPHLLVIPPLSEENIQWNPDHLLRPLSKENGQWIPHLTPIPPLSMIKYNGYPIFSPISFLYAE